MATSAVPAVIDALVTACTAALPDVSVVDGSDFDEAPGDFLLIGVEDPDLPNLDFSAEAQQDWATTGINGARDESGEIVCAAMSWNGEGEQKRARDAAYAIQTAVENLLRTTPTLGLPTLLWTSFGTREQLSQGRGLALVIFRITFEARI